MYAKNKGLFIPEYLLNEVKNITILKISIFFQFKTNFYRIVYFPKQIEKFQIRMFMAQIFLECRPNSYLKRRALKIWLEFLPTLAGFMG